LEHGCFNHFFYTIPADIIIKEKDTHTITKDTKEERMATKTPKHQKAGLVPALIMIDLFHVIVFKASDTKNIDQPSHKQYNLNA